MPVHWLYKQWYCQLYLLHLVARRLELIAENELFDKAQY